MNEPTPSGFDSPGLADIFKVQYQWPSTTSKSSPSGSRTDHRTAIIVGCSVGGIACVTLVVGLGLSYRRLLHHRILGSQFPPQELDNQGKVELDNQENVVQEMDNQENFIRQMDHQGRGVPELDNHENFVQEMDNQDHLVQGMEAKNNMYWELPAENEAIERSEESPSSSRPRRSWVPADEKVSEISYAGNGSEGSSGASRRTSKKLPPLPPLPP